jgi:hypothetical protein
MKGRNILLLIVIAFLTATWCVALPFFWTHGLSVSFGVPYATALHILIPHFVLASVVACCLLLASLRKRIAIFGFVLAAIFSPFLTSGPNDPARDAWYVSMPLLLVLAWRYRTFLAVQA